MKLRYAFAGRGFRQPFLFRLSRYAVWFGSQRGILTRKHRNKLKQEVVQKRGAIFSSTSDSEILAHDYSHNPSLMGKSGSAQSESRWFAYLLMFEDKLIAARSSFRHCQ